MLYHCSVPRLLAWKIGCVSRLVDAILTMYILFDFLLELLHFVLELFHTVCEKNLLFLREIVKFLSVGFNVISQSLEGFR